MSKCVSQAHSEVNWIERSSWVTSGSKSAFDGIKKGFKKVKDGLTSPNMKYDILIPKTTYFLGEKIEGKILIDPYEYVEIDKATITLSSIEQVTKTRYNKRRITTYDRSIRRNIISEEVIPEEYTEKAQLYTDSRVCNLNCVVNSGMRKQEPFNIMVPLTGRGTYKSINSNLDWILGLKIESNGRRDVSKTYSIQVAANPMPGGMQTPVVIQKESTTTTEIEVVYCRYCGTKNIARQENCSRCNGPLH